jgi:NAD(P)-dependent dehydrogenase (short-subunit alcohol dehydrogenase family)
MEQSSCVEAMEEVTRMTGGGVWAVVNDAGVPQAGSLEDVSDEQARYLLEVNLLGPCGSVASPPADASMWWGPDRECVVVSGRVPWPLGGWYSASKHALSALTPCLRVEMAHAGVRVSLVEPSPPQCWTGDCASGWAAAPAGGIESTSGATRREPQR